LRCDVAVIGGGPAGSVAAATLARRGAQVVLIDGSHPREKPCGGGYTGRALALIDPLVPTDALDATRIRHARFLDSTRSREASVELTARDNTLVVASRARVDSALFEAAGRAGAMVLEGRVTSITPGRPHRILVDRGTAIDATLVIGADGANSLVRRTFSRPFRRAELSLATGFYARGVTDDAIVLEMVDEPSGYIWSFPRRDHLAIGICAQADDTTVGEARDALTRWMTRTGISHGAALEPYSWPIPSLSQAGFASLEFAGDGWLTIGDAAGLVDPITREGIYFAVQSAMLAADAIGAGVAAAAATYSRRLREEIVPELALAARLKAGFFRPRCTRLLIDALSSSAKIQAVMADLVAGTQPYRTLRRRLIATMEFRLAWSWWRSVQRTA